MPNYKAILDQLGVKTYLTGKNTIPGQISVRCPFCDDHSNHGHFDPKSGFYGCWRCKGGHPIAALMRLGNINYETAKKLVGENKGSKIASEVKPIEHAKTLELAGTSLAMPMHKSYLEGRNFDIQELEFYHGIKYTGPMYKWNNIDFQWRVIIPIFDVDNKLVSFQGRDVTGKQELRYKCCPVDLAIKHHKHTLYGAELCTKKNRIVVVEGVFDAWRLGAGAVATFGTSVTKEQIKLMAQWQEIVLAFDPEPDAQKHANEIATELAAIGRKVYQVNCDFGKTPDGKAKDFADLSPDDGKQFMLECGL